MELNKENVAKTLLKHFESERDSLIQSARSAHLASTHEESRAEDRHDTFAIEASYLAAGQAARVADLEKTIAEFQNYLQNQAPHLLVSLGTLVTYQMDGNKHTAFVCNLGGGTKILIENKPIQTLSINSPLGEYLKNTKVGEEIEFEIREQEKIINIIELL